MSADEQVAAEQRAASSDPSGIAVKEGVDETGDTAEQEHQFTHSIRH